MSQKVEVELSDEDIADLSKAFRVDDGDEEALKALLTGISAASMREYALHFSGRRVPAGIRDLRELRLRLLAESLPDGLPADSHLAELFRLTSTQARNLVAGTRARYPDEFSTLMRQRARNALIGGALQDDDKVRIEAGDSLASFLRDLLADSTAPPLMVRSDAARTYDLGEETVAALCEKLELDASLIGSQSS